MEVLCVEYPPFRNNMFENIFSWSTYFPFQINDVVCSGSEDSTYLPFQSNGVVCSGSEDSTICFWDIRTNRKFYNIKEKDGGIRCIEFVAPKNKKKKFINDDNYKYSLCYGTLNGSICMWG
ncbi:hypothetical protein RFI_22023 [Reticulomyxa filosa]|uniref:WD-40 repeat protein n=1 Tax=Reticulomyxa filosa TaxID=46433 RepID=X6MNW0_RETFI|nr:hypothetical protein RFI_22023 [Reticulomyxa filosa]|eukprot:ETO15341.1 hypothetical protein RFI_22023 [Reticulomyxa filosa]